MNNTSVTWLEIEKMLAGLYVILGKRNKKQV